MKLLSIFLVTQTLKNLCVCVLFVLIFYISDLWFNVVFRQVSRSLFILLSKVIKIIKFLKKPNSNLLKLSLQESMGLEN